MAKILILIQILMNVSLWLEIRFLEANPLGRRSEEYKLTSHKFTKPSGGFTTSF